jgi:hypothetical protein
MYAAKQNNPALAAALIGAATAFIAATTLLAKMLGTDTLGPPLHPLQISHGRFLFAFVSIAMIATAVRPVLGKPHWGLHIGRTLAGWVSRSCLHRLPSFRYPMQLPSHFLIRPLR